LLFLLDADSAVEDPATALGSLTSIIWLQSDCCIRERKL
jgi:hypothetical protein